MTLFKWNVDASECKESGNKLIGKVKVRYIIEKEIKKGENKILNFIHRRQSTVI